MYKHFNLTLAVTHACNLRCTYCYTGAKFNRVMTEQIGHAAINRAMASILPGGTLSLGFFGGEPLLEAQRIQSLIDFARSQSSHHGINLKLNMTTNGTVTNETAWSIMTTPDMELSISCDGPPHLHDKHRVTIDGQGTSKCVEQTLSRLTSMPLDFHVICVVRPDTVKHLPDTIEYFYDLGVTSIEPSLDLWTSWTTADIQNLEIAIGQCAQIWKRELTRLRIGWFDEKAAQLAQIPMESGVQCGYGQAELAVSPSGRLYPCERLIGEDVENQEPSIPGNVLVGKDFLNIYTSPSRNKHICGECVLSSDCNTICRCSNYIRTGDVSKPDGLLCAWNQSCLQETATAMHNLVQLSVSSSTKGEPR